MKVLLIRPYSTIEAVPPIGLGYLSHAVKTFRGDDTFLIDGRRFHMSPSDIIKQVAAINPDVIGVGALSYEAPEAALVIAEIKRNWPDIPVVLGGPHATACEASTLHRINADYVVVGEGEETFIELLNALESKRSIGDVRGVAWRDCDEVVFNGYRPFINEMDQLEVDWEVIGPENYFGIGRGNPQRRIAKSGRRLMVFTSRGCPYACTYCHHIFGKRYRIFDTGKTISRMIELRDRYRVREFEIIDDNFNLNSDRAKRFMEEIIERKLDCAIAFPNGLRADLMDEELIDLMTRAGVYRVHYAIETASKRIQKLIKKNLDLDRAREVVNMTASRGIITGTFNMLGFPTETEEEMSQTVNFAISLNNHITSFFYLNPFPGTEIVESTPQLKERSRELDFNGYSGVTMNLSAVPDDKLMEIRRSAYRRFYFSPRRIARIFRDVPKNFTLLFAAYTVGRLSFRENVRY